MAEVLGLGVTHFPPLSGTDETMGWILKRALEDPAIPAAGAALRATPDRRGRAAECDPCFRRCRKAAGNG